MTNTIQYGLWSDVSKQWVTVNGNVLVGTMEEVLTLRTGSFNPKPFNVITYSDYIAEVTVVSV